MSPRSISSTARSDTSPRSTQFPEATTGERFEDWLDEGVSDHEKCLACSGTHQLTEDDYFLEGDAPPPR